LKKCSSNQVVIATAAGIGAGVIAAIVIGTVIGVVLLAGGGKVGYDYYAKHRGKMSAPQSNPLYEEKNSGSGENPLYIDDSFIKKP